MGVCCILIKSAVNGDDVVVSVSNTGSYIDEDVLDKLRSGTIIPNGTGIGLLNIETRIKLIFGEKYGLFFRNTDKATVEIHLPQSTKNCERRFYG